MARFWVLLRSFCVFKKYRLKTVFMEVANTIKKIKAHACINFYRQNNFGDWTKSNVYVIIKSKFQKPPYIILKR